MGITNQNMIKPPTKARLYINVPLNDGKIITLPSDQMHYLLYVLRLGVGAPIAVFNGIDGEYLATIIEAVKSGVRLASRCGYDRKSNAVICGYFLLQLKKPVRFCCSESKRIGSTRHLASKN